jgi:hypothetical protein
VQQPLYCPHLVLASLNQIDMQKTEFEATDSALSFLLSPPGHTLLAELATLELDKSHVLGHITRLRKDLAPDIVAAALDLTLLRIKARDKFQRADEMFFTRESLEQASAERLSPSTARSAMRAILPWPISAVASAATPSPWQCTPTYWLWTGACSACAWPWPTPRPMAWILTCMRSALT